MKEELDKYQVLETTAILALAAIVFGQLFHSQSLIYGAAALLFLGLFVKKIAQYVAFGWLRLAELLGSINTKIILSAVFFLLLTPLAYIFRQVKGDYLGIKKKTAQTLWHKRDHVYKGEDFSKPW